MCEPAHAHPVPISFAPDSSTSVAEKPTHKDVPSAYVTLTKSFALQAALVPSWFAPSTVSDIFELGSLDVVGDTASSHSERFSVHVFDEGIASLEQERNHDNSAADATTTKPFPERFSRLSAT